jgi:hypothetical protein
MEHRQILCSNEHRECCILILLKENQVLLIDQENPWIQLFELLKIKFDLPQSNQSSIDN